MFVYVFGFVYFLVLFCCVVYVFVLVVFIIFFIVCGCVCGGGSKCCYGIDVDFNFGDVICKIYCDLGVGN